MYSWNTDWPLNLWLTVLTLLVFISIVLGGYLLQRVQVAPYATTKRSTWLRVCTLVSLRLIALLVLFLMLSGATYTKLISTSAEIWFVVDRSASMLQKDEPGDSNQPSSRIQRSLEIVHALKSQWNGSSSNPQFKYFAIGSQLNETDDLSLENLKRESNSNAFDAESRLGNSLYQLMQQVPVARPQAIVVLTDGRVTEGMGLASVAINQTAPATKTFVLAAGDIHELPVLEIVDLNQPSIVFVGDQVQLKTQLRAKNLNGASVKVNLQHVESGEVLASSTKLIDNDEAVIAIDLPLASNQAGLQKYQLTAAVASGKSANSLIAQRGFALQVRQEPLPVLLVASSFSYEVRFLKHFLERTRRQGAQSEQVFAPTFCIRDAERRFVRAEPTMVSYLPAEQNWWNQFETCIFVDPQPELIDATLAKTIQTAVTEQGMGLVFIAGRANALSAVNSSLWKTVLPITQSSAGTRSNMHVRFTNQSRDFGVNLNEELVRFQNKVLPRITTAGLSFRPTLTASILAGELNSPFLLTHFVGGGQIYFQSTDESYRWRSLQGSDAIFNAYWSELISSSAKSNRLASGPPTLMVNSSQEHWYTGQSIDLRLDLSGSGIDIGDDVSAIPVLINSVDHSSVVQVNLNRTPSSNIFRSTTTLPQVGSYAITLDRQQKPELKLNLAGTLTVDPRPNEAADPGADMNELKEFASKCSGVLLPMDQWRSIVDQLPPEKVLHFEPMPPKSIWNYPLLVALVIGILGTEWFLRNRWGLI